MKIAVITPHWNTPVEYLQRNMGSVAMQETNHDVHHFLIADGHDCDEQDALIKSFQKATHIRLPIDCNDAGSTPCVIGSYVARSLGYEAYFFLGDDNIFLRDHVESCVTAHLQTKCDVVASQRFFMTPDGEELPIPEEIGHIDANCLALFGNAIRYHHMSAMMPKSLSQINDRIFIKVLSSRFKIALTNKKTVGYATKWAAHYRLLGREVPPWSKESVGGEAQKWLDETPENIKNDWFNYLYKDS